jgi:hypothetical protein
VVAFLRKPFVRLLLGLLATAFPFALMGLGVLAQVEVFFPGVPQLEPMQLHRPTFRSNIQATLIWLAWRGVAKLHLVIKCAPFELDKAMATFALFLLLPLHFVPVEVKQTVPTFLVAWMIAMPAVLPPKVKI